MIDEKRLIAFLRREILWEKSEAKLSKDRPVQGYFKGSIWTLRRVARWVREERKNNGRQP